LNAGLLYRKLRQHGIYQPQPGWSKFMLKIAVAIVAMAAALLVADRPACWWIAAGWPQRLGLLSGLVVLGAGVYFACLGALGFRPTDFRRRAA
jgi:putative peptidoglycan lipid II flippase